MSRLFLSLYRGDPAGGHAFLVARWPTLQRARMLARKITRQQVFHVRATLALGAVSSVGDPTTRAEFLADAKKFGTMLGKLPVIGSQPLCDLTLAALAFTQGRTAEARERLERAIPAFDKAEMKGYANAARYRLGAVANKPELTAEARAWFASQRVADVERFLDVLAPGFTRVA
jgi:hypothetical protein